MATRCLICRQDTKGVVMSNGCTFGVIALGMWLSMCGEKVRSALRGS